MSGCGIFIFGDDPHAKSSEQLLLVLRGVTVLLHTLWIVSVAGRARNVTPLEDRLVNGLIGVKRKVLSFPLEFVRVGAEQRKVSTSRSSGESASISAVSALANVASVWPGEVVVLNAFPVVGLDP